MTARGFTLLEIMVAVAVFGVMAALAYGGLNQLVDQQRHLETLASRFARIQKSLHLLERDLHYATPRGVRDALGTPEPALIGGNQGGLLALTRATDEVTRQVGLVRIEYALDKGVLQRRSWPVLDRMPQHEPTVQPLIDGVEAVDIRFAAGARWSGSWPPDGAQTAGTPLPEAVEIEVSLRNGARYRRVVALAERVGGAG